MYYSPGQFVLLVSVVQTEPHSLLKADLSKRKQENWKGDGASQSSAERDRTAPAIQFLPSLMKNYVNCEQQDHKPETF